MTDDDAVARHYTKSDLTQRIMEAVHQIVPDMAHVTPRDLAPVDEFHIGGVKATEAFMPKLGIRPGMAVLDIGSGIGGTARFIADAHDCHVTGIDLTPEFCAVTTMLSAATSLSECTEFLEGSALTMPFHDARFEATMTLHVAVNIEDKTGLYREVARVLKPAAMFGIYDIMVGPQGGDLDFPVPWSTTPETSYLATPEAMREALGAAGFTIELEEDRTGLAIEFFEILIKASAEGPSPLGLHVIMGDDFKVKIANLLGNINAGRFGPREMICRRT